MMGLINFTMQRCRRRAMALSALLIFAIYVPRVETFATRSSTKLVQPTQPSSLTRLFATQPPFKHETDCEQLFGDDRSDGQLSVHTIDRPDVLPIVVESAVESGVPVFDNTSMGSKKLGVWAARGLLLLVAAIWGLILRYVGQNPSSRIVARERLTDSVAKFPVLCLQSVKYLENLCFHPPCHHPPSEAALARFGLAATVSLPLLFRQRWDVIRAGLECGLWISLGYATQALALSTIDSGQCAFICSLTVVFVPVASASMYGKPLRLTNLLAAAVALAGVGVLEGMLDVDQLLGIPPAVAAHTSMLASGVVETTVPLLPVTVLAQTGASTVVEASTGPLTALADTFGINTGDILALGQPIGFGMAFLRIEHYQEQFKDVPNRVLTIAAAQCVAVGILSFLWVLYDFNGALPNFSYMIEPHRIAAICWTGIVTTVVAIFIEGIALQSASATDASLAFSTEPVWASLFGFILLHETLDRNSYAGGTLILIACVIGAVSDLVSSGRERPHIAQDDHPQLKE